VTRFLIVLIGVFIAGCNNISDPVQLGPAVHGIVYDVATQAPIPGVRIEVAGRVAITNSNGSYYLADVPKGLQVLTATRTGYAKYVTDVQVASDANEKKFYLQPV
jgi:hypothetical protein